VSRSVDKNKASRSLTLKLTTCGCGIWLWNFYRGVNLDIRARSARARTYENERKTTSRGRECSRECLYLRDSKNFVFNASQVVPRSNKRSLQQISTEFTFQDCDLKRFQKIHLSDINCIYLSLCAHVEYAVSRAKRISTSPISSSPVYFRLFVAHARRRARCYASPIRTLIFRLYIRVSLSLRRGVRWPVARFAHTPGRICMSRTRIRSEANGVADWELT